MIRILFLASLAICANAESLAQSTAKPSLLSPERIHQHLLMGWALPEPGVGERVTRQTPETPAPELTTPPPAHGLSQTLVQQHLLMGWSLPEAGPGPRPVRAAPRAPPAHRAHGPRAPLVYTHQGHRPPHH